MSDDDTERLITSSNKKSTSFDPIPTKLVIECLDVLLPVITKIINLSLESGIFPCVWKEADFQPRLKKQGLEFIICTLRLQLKFGLSGTILKWFTSYLSQRIQRLTVGGVSSDKFNVDFGVPQGSCLGPLLFVLYVSELLELIKRHLPGAYADDTQLYISFRADSRIDQETAVRTVEMCIDDIKRWMLANRLKLNEGKTEVILIGTWQQLEKIDFNDIRVGSNVVTCVENAKNLGC
ncbi:Hypothetical predicted protein, partial [Paramuricea clavata]